MNREDIIRMAKNSGLFVELVLERDLDWLERFAALVTSAEREACAKLCEEGEFMTFGCVAEAIRERGDNK